MAITEIPRVVQQYNKDGVFIAEYKSAKEASKQIGGSSNAKACIRACCNILHPMKTYKGFIWKYKE